MKHLLIVASLFPMLLTGCSSLKEEPNPAQQISVEEAIARCQQAAGTNTDSAAFDACMKDKGFQRKAAVPAAQ
ncbi:hypothetical protein ACM67B_09285 [Neisseria sp. CCUG17229]|uniref:hypothetical protein n=1 Tax=Neisseria sp. CCUG17229 TaxID=3392036 RepID=UPI003A10273B